MKSDLKFFKNSKTLPVDKFLNNVLYDKKYGYYNSKIPFGKQGDFTTSPKISSLYSEMIAIWMISTWEKLGKPKNFNIVELGPGDGTLVKVLLNVFKKFPSFYNAKKLFLFEKSKFLTKLQRENIDNTEVKWIKNFDNIKKGPVIFFGNEFFDAIPIKQFKRSKKNLLEKYYKIKDDYEIFEIFKKASVNDKKMINSFKTLKNLNFIEFPKNGFDELKKIIKKISILKGCILLVDYGYLKENNQSTLQSVFKHKKNFLLKNLGKSDITYHVNFSLLSEFFLKNKLKVKKTVTQREFLNRMGIKLRAEILSKKMKFRDQSDLYSRLQRLIDPGQMGHLFKIILAYNLKINKYPGFK